MKYIDEHPNCKTVDFLLEKNRLIFEKTREVCKQETYDWSTIPKKCDYVTNKIGKITFDLK